MRTAQRKPLTSYDEPGAGPRRGPGKRTLTGGIVARPSGAPLPGLVQARMEDGFGFGFGAVRVHEQSEDAVALGARAYTQGTEVHFAPGQYQPGTPAGNELIAHELTHVVQQVEGRVGATAELDGVAINHDDTLEREADDLGRRVARGEPVGVAAAPTQRSAAGGSVVQRQAAGGAPNLERLTAPTEDVGYEERVDTFGHGDSEIVETQASAERADGVRTNIDTTAKHRRTVVAEADGTARVDLELMAVTHAVSFAYERNQLTDDQIKTIKKLWKKQQQGGDGRKSDPWEMVEAELRSEEGTSFVRDLKMYSFNDAFFENSYSPTARKKMHLESTLQVRDTYCPHVSSAASRTHCYTFTGEQEEPSIYFNSEGNVVIVLPTGEHCVIDSATGLALAGPVTLTPVVFGEKDVGFAYDGEEKIGDHELATTDRAPKGWTENLLEVPD
jgi:hypothetical protein